MTRFEKLTFWSGTIAVAATGFTYAWMKYLLEPLDPFAVINHPLQPLVLKLHILTAPVLVFAIGLIALRHIWPHFRAGGRRGRRSGIAVGLVLGPMIASGYLIQAVTHIGLLRALALSHLALGIMFVLAAAAHHVASRRRVAHRSTSFQTRPVDPDGVPVSDVSTYTSPSRS